MHIGTFGDASCRTRLCLRSLRNLFNGGFRAVGLAGIPIGIIMIQIAKKWPSQRRAKVTGYVMAVFGSLWSAGAFLWTYSQYTKCVKAYRTRSYEIVDEASTISHDALTRATRTNASAFRVNGSATQTTKFKRDLTVLPPTEDLFGQGYLCESHTIRDRFSDLKFVPTRWRASVKNRIGPPDVRYSLAILWIHCRHCVVGTSARDAKLSRKRTSLTCLPNRSTI